MTIGAKSPHSFDLWVIALTALVAMTSAMAVSLALEQHLRSRKMRIAGAMFVFGSAAITAIWLLRNPMRFDDLVGPLVENIVKYGYPAVALLALTSSRAGNESSMPPATARLQSIERRRRIKVILGACVGVAGIAAASTGIYLSVSPWRWLWLACGWLVTMAATVMILFAVRQQIAPAGWAIAQPDGRCIKPGERYLPKDGDRQIPIKPRPASFPLELPADLRTTAVIWCPCVENLDAFIMYFGSDATVEAKLNEFVALGLPSRTIKRHAQLLGIQIDEVTASRNRVPARRM